MRRLLFALLGLAFIAGAVWDFLSQLDALYGNIWIDLVLKLGLPFLLLILGLVSIDRAFSRNIYCIHEGEVIGRQFNPEHTTPGVYVPGIPATANSPGTATIYVPPVHVPAEWLLCLRDIKGREGWIPVTRTEYRAYQIGSHYPCP